jgi:hypothetical protein
MTKQTDAFMLFVGENFSGTERDAVIKAGLTGTLIAKQAAEAQCAELLAALEQINTAACYATEDATETCETMLLRIGETARAAIAKATADRKPLQAAGLHPAPCASHCEAKSFQVEIRRLTNEFAKQKETLNHEQH